jgi:hypothetical protein
MHKILKSLQVSASRIGVTIVQLGVVLNLDRNRLSKVVD